MRATEGNRRTRVQRQLVGLVAAAVMALSVIGGGTAFASAPTAAWGSFTPDTVTTGAQPALVSSGRVASFTVSLRNDDTSTISQLYLKAVTQASAPAPEVTGLFFVSSTRCSAPTTTQVTLSCSFRNVKPHNEVTVQVGFVVPISTASTCLEGRARNFGTPPSTITGSNVFCVNFLWSTTGATTSDQNNTSHGDVWNFYDGVATSADTNVASTYVFKFGQFTVENGALGGGNGQSTKAVVNETLQGVSVSDGTAIDAINCSTSTLSASDCANFNKYRFGEWSFMTVGTTGSQPGGGAFAITISIDPSVYPLPSGVNKNNLRVYHTYDTGSGTTEEIISGACAKSNPTLPCLTSVSVSKTLVQVTFLTLHNGKGGMF
jgi:hypothetical protein